MNYGITAKAAMYAIPLFLTPFADGLKDLLTRGEWPTMPLVTYCAFLGTIQMCVGLRAFYDGSAERSKQDIKASDLEPETKVNIAESPKT